MSLGTLGVCLRKQPLVVYVITIVIVIVVVLSGLLVYIGGAGGLKFSCILNLDVTTLKLLLQHPTCSL